MEDLINNKIVVLIENNTKDEGQQWEWDLISKIYHVATSDVADGQIEDNKSKYCKKYIDICKSLDEYKFKPIYSRQDVILPPFNKSNFKTDFLDVLKERKTNRVFINYKYSLDEFSSLLYLVFGEYHGEDGELKEKGFIQHSKRRMNPSSGNMHPGEVFIYIFNVEGVEPGFYYYNPEKHFLTKVNEKNIDYSILKSICYGQFFGENCSFTLFLVSRFNKIWWKYKHSRSYKLAYFESGTVAQNLQLAITAQKQHFWQTGHFKDSEISKYLQLEEYETCTFTFCVGKGTGNAIPENFNNSY